VKTELADVNVLVAVAVDDHDDHALALDWLRRAERFATTPVTEIGLVRLLLNPHVVDGVDLAAALVILRGLRELPAARFWPDETSLADRRALTAHVRGTRQVTDAHLLNLAIARGGLLVTFDGRLRAALPPQQRHHVRVLGADPAGA